MARDCSIRVTPLRNARAGGAASSKTFSEPCPEPRPEPGVGPATGPSVGQFPGVPFDLHHYRRVFPGRWAELLRAHFPSHLHAAVALGVTERAARGWWDGINAPRAEVVLGLIAARPEALGTLLRDAA